MTRGLKRFHQSKDPHFITFSCYQRSPFLYLSEATNTFVAALERVRRTYELRVFGYVVMPEHVHLLLSEPQRGTLADAIKSLKQGVSRRLIGEAALLRQQGPFLLHVEVRGWLAPYGWFEWIRSHLCRDESAARMGHPRRK